MHAEAVIAAPEARPVLAPKPIETAQRWIWQSRYGGIVVIEVRGDDAYVNGQKVQKAAGASI